MVRKKITILILLLALVVFYKNMPEEKVYTNTVVEDNPFPGEPALLDISPVSQEGVFNAKVSKDKTFPKKKIATELLSQALNTRSRKILGEFEFTPSGAIQIGDFKEGITGDLRLSPNGVVARDLAGVVTFSIDGTTGDAIFKGTVQSGSIISGSIISGDIILGGEDNEEGILTVNAPNGSPHVVIDKDSFTTFVTDGPAIGEKYFELVMGTATSGHMNFYGDSNQTVPIVRIDSFENTLYASNISVGGSFGGGLVEGRLDVYYGDNVSSIMLDALEGITTFGGKPICIEGLATPDAPAVANGVKLYLDTSGGKTRLMALFESGAAQVVSTEP